MSERTNEATKPEIPGRLKRKRIFGHANGDQEEKRARKGERERGSEDGKNKEVETVSSYFDEYAWRGPI